MGVFAKARAENRTRMVLHLDFLTNFLHIICIVLFSICYLCAPFTLLHLFINDTLIIFAFQCFSADLPSTIVQMDDEGLISELFKCLVMVAIHVSCVGTQTKI